MCTGAKERNLSDDKTSNDDNDNYDGNDGNFDDNDDNVAVCTGVEERNLAKVNHSYLCTRKK